MWKCRSSYGDECCSLRDSFITEAAFENKVLYMRFEDGFVLLPETWANPFKGKSYRSDASLVAIPVDDRRVSIPQDAIQIIIHGINYLFGKAVGLYAKEITVEQLLADIGVYHDKYEIMNVYLSEDGKKLLFQGAVHAERSGILFSKEDVEFEFTVLLREGAQMRYFWNELDMKKPV